MKPDTKTHVPVNWSRCSPNIDMWTRRSPSSVSAHELAHAPVIRVLCGYRVNGARTLTAAEISRIQETHDRSVLEDTAYAGALGATSPRRPTVDSTQYGSSKEPAVARRDGRSVSWRRFRRGLARRGHRRA